MFHLIKPNTKINFLGQRYVAFALSILLIIISIGSLATKGLNLDVDFTGGVIIEVAYPDAVELATVRKNLADHDYGDATVQYFGSSSDIMIRLGPQKGQDANEVSGHILTALRSDNANVELRKVDFVGSQVSGELVNKGSLALLYTIFGILVYVIIRFHWKLAAGSVVALTHDVIITAGMFSVFGWTFDLTVLAALLAILGYSVNDTIVIFDRHRENYRRMRKSDTTEVMNVSINETLSRTIVTVLTTALTLSVLFLFGGDSVHEFSKAMLIGIGFGTYSSVYIASAIAKQLKLTKEDIYPPKRDEDESFDPEMP